MIENIKTYSMFWYAGCGDNTWDDDGVCKLCGGNMHEFNSMQGEYVLTSDYMKLLDLLERIQRPETDKSLLDAYE